MSLTIPRPPDGGKRHPLNMRTTAHLRGRLEAAAVRSGRSLAQEVEHRLEMSFAPNGGRPRHGPPGDGERVPLGLRVTRPARVALELAADASGRSLSQEAEYRLQATFDEDRLVERIINAVRTGETACTSR